MSELAGLMLSFGLASAVWLIAHEVSVWRELSWLDRHREKERKKSVDDRRKQGLKHL